MELKQKIQQTSEVLENKSVNLVGSKVTVGFDGFIDEIIHVVDTRQNKDTFKRIGTIKEYGERIVSAAGKSLNMEMVPVMKKVGGNGPLMAMAVSGMGCDTTCIGLLGFPEVDTVFSPLKERCKLLTVGEPGHTDALEFQDGKLLMGKLNTISQMSWPKIKEVIGESEFDSIINTSQLVACTNWTMLTEMDGILTHLLENQRKTPGPTFFFDLADPQKRSRKEINAVLQSIQNLSKYTSVYLGLNLRESEQVADVIGVTKKMEDGPDVLAACATALQEALDITGVVIHSVKCAGASDKNGSAGVLGPYCPAPKITTGAGDHFNGGFCSGLLCDMSLESCLYTGVATSGWYVRGGGPSPTASDVIGLLRKWALGEPLD